VKGRRANKNINCNILCFFTQRTRDLQSFEIRFESAVPIRFESDGPIRIFESAMPAHWSS